MPLFSYKCDTCGQEITNLVFGEAPKSVKCPECGKRATRRYKPISRIEMNPEKGKYTSISTKEWEKDQEIKARRGKEDLENAKKKAKKEILSTPGIFSERNLQKKREELRNAAKTGS